jgi:hypothetical protein
LQEKHRNGKKILRSQWSLRNLTTEFERDADKHPQIKDFPPRIR